MSATVLVLSLILSVVLAVAVSAAVCWWLVVVRRPDRLVSGLYVRRLVVTTKTGEAFEGLLVGSDDRSVVLRQAVALGDDGARLPVDGELLIPRSELSYMQDPIS